MKGNGTINKKSPGICAGASRIDKNFYWSIFMIKEYYQIVLSNSDHLATHIPWMAKIL